MGETYSQLISTQDSCKYIYFNNWLQNVPTDYWLNSLVQLLQQLVTVHRPTTQPYTVSLTTGYSVPAGYRLHSPVHLLPQLFSECTDRYRLHSPIHLLQLLVTECTGWYLLHSLVHLLQQLVTECTGWYWLHSLVHFNLPLQVYKQGAGY